MSSNLSLSRGKQRSHFIVPTGESRLQIPELLGVAFGGVNLITKFVLSGSGDPEPVKHWCRRLSNKITFGWLRNSLRIGYEMFPAEEDKRLLLCMKSMWQIFSVGGCHNLWSVRTEILLGRQVWNSLFRSSAEDDNLALCLPSLGRVADKNGWWYLTRETEIFLPTQPKRVLTLAVNCLGWCSGEAVFRIDIFQNVIDLLQG